MEFDNARKPFYQLPNEVWLEIFEKVDTPQLRDCSLVCKHWNSLVFKHMSHKFVLNFDLDLRKYPRRGIGMIPERTYKHLCLTSFKLDSPAYLFDIVKQLAVNLISLRLELVSLECQTFVQLLPLCAKLTELHVKAKYFECDETLYEPGPYLKAVRYLSFDVENYVSTFNLFSFEMAFLRMFPNVQKLKMIVYRPLDLGLLVWMAPRLQSLNATVYCDAINNFLGIRLPILKHLDITLLQPEQQWRKRRTFQARAFGEFLRGCGMLKTALLSFRCEYDQQLLTTIFTNLPSVEKLQLSGGLATERFSLNGMDRMKNLKDLSLHCLLLFQEEQRIVPMPTVEKFSLCSFIRPNRFSEVLKRFPNLKTLSFRMYGDELQSINEAVPLLQELSVDIGRLTPDMVNHMQQLVGLTKLSIDAHIIARTNFRLLRGVMALPELKCLTINTRSVIPANIASLVAGSNSACKLVLNGETVTPSARARRSGVKRKQPVAASSPKINPNQSANQSGVTSSMDETQPLESSAASTSGCSSFPTSSSDSSNVSFPVVSCSSPNGRNCGEIAVKIIAASGESSDAASIDEAPVAAAVEFGESTVSLQPSTENSYSSISK